MDDTTIDVDEQKPEISYESGKTLMAHGSQVLNGHMATHIEAALGRALPQMEVRFENLSLSADMVGADEKTDAHELATLVALVFADCPELPTYNETLGAYENVRSELGCQPLANAPVEIGHTTVKEFTEDVFGMKHDEIWSNFGIVLGCIVLFRILALLALRFINHQKR